MMYRTFPFINNIYTCNQTITKILELVILL